MRLYIGFAIFSVMLAAGCREKAPPSGIDLLQEGFLAGPVQSITQQVFSATDSAGTAVDLIPSGSPSENFVKRLSPQGVPLEEFWFDPAGNQTKYIVYTYGKKGNPQEKIYYNPDGSTDQTCRFQYDQIGRLDQLLCRDTLTQVVFSYRFAPNGQLAENTFFLSENTPGTRITYQYDEAGNKTEEFLTVPAFNVQNKWLFSYDTDRRLTQKQLFDASGVLLSAQTFQYTLDDRGNWIRQVAFTDGKAVEVKVREIQYFE